MAALLVRMFAVLFCVVVLLSGCAIQSPITSSSTTAPAETTSITTVTYGAPALGVVTDATLRVLTIDARGAAARTALQLDDVITHWKGEPVTIGSLRTQIAATNPTETVDMTVQRGDTSIIISVQLQPAIEQNTGSQIPSTPTPVPSNLYYF